MQKWLVDLKDGAFEVGNDDCFTAVFKDLVRQSEPFLCLARIGNIVDDASESGGFAIGIVLNFRLLVDDADVS